MRVKIKMLDMIEFFKEIKFSQIEQVSLPKDSFRTCRMTFKQNLLSINDNNLVNKRTLIIKYL